MYKQYIVTKQLLLFIMCLILISLHYLSSVIVDPVSNVVGY